MCTESLSKRINNEAPHDITLIERIYQICVCQGECGQPCTPWLSYVVLQLIKSKPAIKILHMHHRVDLLNGSYTLVPKGGYEGADSELQYVDVAQDLDQSPEGPKANLADEGKPRIINPF
jgi:hypothetical protein